jgi:hypothetical protein
MIPTRDKSGLKISGNITLTVGERATVLGARILLYVVLSVLLVNAMDVLAQYTPGRPWPQVFWIIRTVIFLPLHEGGHFISILFGRTLYVLGGSFWQIMFPLLWFLIALKQRSQVAPFPLFWTGENMMDVSLYMRDAPVRALPLLGGHKSGHDWYNLFTWWGLMDSAVDIADLFYWGGVLIAVGAIIAGVAWAITAFVNEKELKPFQAED